jgi:hypothetical protein
MSGTEITGWSVDRLATVEMGTGGRPGRGIVVPEYEAAVRILGGKPISLVAAEKLIERVKRKDNVIIMTGMGAMPFHPYGETDGPLGVASLARAVSMGLGALPLITSHGRDFEATRASVRFAGLAIVDYEEAQKQTARSAVMMPFPSKNKDESKKIAASIMDKYNPKAVIAVETMGPNKKGFKHFANGIAPDETSDSIPGLEFLFYEAHSRGVPTIACFDIGNEIGGGSIEDVIRKIAPNADMCQCPCKGGAACAVKADIPFPSAISNWGAYAITAMIAYLLGEPEILQDGDTERLMLEGCIWSGSIDGIRGAPIMSVDGVGIQVQQAYVNMLHCIIANALSDIVVAQSVKQF